MKAEYRNLHDLGLGLALKAANPVRLGRIACLVLLLADTRLLAAPTATTLAATNITPGSATLDGTAINNNDTKTRAWFQYGLTTSYGSVSGKTSLNRATGTTPVSYSNTLSGLAVATLYHFCAVATNTTGTSTGADFTFTTLPATQPTMTTNSASGLGITNATLNATVNANGLAGAGWFEWGRTTNYGNMTTITELTAGTTNQNFSTSLGGLDIGATYYFRAVATNSLGATYGSGQSFTTAIFADVTVAVAPGLPGIYNGSVAWGDYDGDGLLDFLIMGYIGGTSGTFQIWHNTGSGFENATVSLAPGLPGIAHGTAAWGDYNNDAQLDLLLTGTPQGGPFYPQLWRNTGSGLANVTVAAAPGLPAIGFSSLAWGDYDNDGHLDFLILGQATTNSYNIPIAQIWHNTGSNFVEVTPALAPGLAGQSGGSVAWADYDGDGWLDFLITGGGHSAQLWHNTGSNFVEVTATVAPGLPTLDFSSVAWGDYDSDGRLDFLIAGSGYSGSSSKIWHNTGSNFVDVTASVAPGLPGIIGGSVAWGDFDNDGRLDFLIAGSSLSQIWRNTGSNFVNVTAIVAPSLSGVQGGSVAWADYDHDGRLDFLIAGNSTSGAKICQIWRNFTPQTNTAPTAPSGLAMTTSPKGALLSWSAASDAETPSAGLSYNVRAGSTPGGGNLLAAHVNPANGFRTVPALGNAQKRLFLPLAGVTNGQTVYWSVQAVDGAFAGGPFASETSVVSIPAMSLAVGTGADVTLQWSPPTWGWRLQETSDLNADGWSDSSLGEVNPVVIAPTNAARFYRLLNPW